MTRFSIHEGDIFDLDVDTIVNPANSFLRHGGGLARAIADRAAPPGSLEFHRPTESQKRIDASADWYAEQAMHPNIPGGGAGWTSAGRLPYKGIVHAVGPIWGGGGYMERQLLASAHSSALRLAWQHGCTSIAIPAISCGIFGYPIEEAAEVAVPIVCGMASYMEFERVYFALPDPQHAAEYRAHLDARDIFRRAMVSGNAPS